MRTLITIITLLLTINASANVICEKNGRYWYPKNETAIKIAQSLGVKTCNGRRFKAVVKKLNLKSNVKAAKKSMTVDEVVEQFGK